MNDLSLLDKALCLNCLGRLFGRLGHGYTNRERAHVIASIGKGGALSEELRIFSEALGGKEFYPVIDEDDCYICRGLMREIPKFSELAASCMERYEYDNFQVGVRVDTDISRREEQVWSVINATHQEPIKAELNREIGKLVQNKTGKEAEFAKPQLVAIIDTSYDHVDVQVSPLFIYGRYRKLARGIPQTKWPCRKCRGHGCEDCEQTGKQYRITVEELISEHVMELTGGEGAKFHGMGREDIDARMLGRGRPFVLEISKPLKRSLDLEGLMETINGKSVGQIEVSGLTGSSRDMVKWAKAATFAKIYSARVEFSRPVARAELEDAVKNLSGAVIKQRTPVRVSHRRADLVRERTVRTMDLADHDGSGGKWAVITIKGDSGLYIKELLHSDEGRTSPSLKGLLGGKDTPDGVSNLTSGYLSSREPLDVEIVHLDVLDVCDENAAEN